MKLIEHIINFLNKLLYAEKSSPSTLPSIPAKVKDKKKQKKNSSESTKKEFKKLSKGVKLIVIDPGHGGTDTGATYIDPLTNSIILEKKAALETALTLKYILVTKYGWKVLLTRSNDVKPRYSYRTGLANKENADAFVSIHYNSPGTYGLMYYAAEKDRPISKRLAELLDKHMGFNKIWKSTQSRFGRLYIDDVRVDIPSVMVEVDPIDGYEGTKEYRLKKANEIAKALDEFFAGSENGNS